MAHCDDQLDEDKCHIVEYPVLSQYKENIPPVRQNKGIGHPLEVIIKGLPLMSQNIS